MQNPLLRMRTKERNRFFIRLILFWFLVLKFSLVFGIEIKVVSGDGIEVVDSILIFSNQDKITYKFEAITREKLNKLDCVTILAIKNKKICIRIDYDKIFCDTIKIKLNQFPDCTPTSNLIGTYQSCQGMGHTYGFFSFDYPCCPNVELAPYYYIGKKKYYFSKKKKKR
ncbi:MAG: hypothetical protein JNL75_02485 [Chitinophagales bacterium]|nr:hypothetical protein [Chitinophagales bacterium]